jgi:hypothetical protein
MDIACDLCAVRSRGQFCLSQEFEGALAEVEKDDCERSMNWSKWVLFGYLAIGIAIGVFEFMGLRKADDEWPTITTLVVTAIKSKWWAGVCIFGFLIWLLIHFAIKVWPHRFPPELR